MGPWLLSHGRTRRYRTDAAEAAGLQWGRGFSATEGHFGGGDLPPRGGLQWGRGFSATEGIDPGRFWARVTLGFNGAVASQPRKAVAAARLPKAPFCFNGAVASQPRKAALASVPLSSQLGFNGAVASQPRKDIAGTGVTIPCHELQWGRGFSATEGSDINYSISANVRLQWGRGFSATEGSIVARGRGCRAISFNGAVASQPRKGQRL